MQENTDNMFVQERTLDRNCRRRARYAQMSPERKELFLSQLREKRAELKRQKLLRQSNSTAALTINTSLLFPQQDLPLNSTTGERIANCLSTFEEGSTSNASHITTKVNSTYTANKGVSFKLILLMVLLQPQHLALPLQSENLAQLASPLRRAITESVHHLTFWNCWQKTFSFKCNY